MNEFFCEKDTHIHTYTYTHKNAYIHETWSNKLQKKNIKKFIII